MKSFSDITSYAHAAGVVKRADMIVNGFISYASWTPDRKKYGYIELPKNKKPFGDAFGARIKNPLFYRTKFNIRN